MTDLFQQSSQKLDATITEIQHAIAAGLANKQCLFETMRKLYGEGSANGTWSQRDAFDLLEAALTRHMAGLLNKPQMLHQISEISALIEALPTHIHSESNRFIGDQRPASRVRYEVKSWYPDDRGVTSGVTPLLTLCVTCGITPSWKSEASATRRFAGLLKPGSQQG